MALCVTSLSFILHIFLMIFTSAKYFAYSTTTWQQTEDVWVCIQMKNDGQDIQTDSECVPENSLHFMFHLYDNIIKYRLKRADTELKDSDFPVFYLKGGKLHPISIDNISKESGLVSQEVYKSEDSTIVLACYSTADAQHKYQLSGVFQLNDTFWTILPLPKQNGSDEKNSRFFLGEDTCYWHRILKLSSGHFFSLSQRNQFRTKRSVYSAEYILDLAFMIDSTVTDFFIKNMPSSWELSFSKVSFILKEYYSFLLLTINEFFKKTKIEIKCPILVYSGKSQPMDWAKPKTNDNVTDTLTALKEIGDWLKKFPKNSLHTADHIMLVTRYPLDKAASFLNGYTRKSGLCTEQRLSIIQEEFDGSVALAATQLIVYNIGINFDGFQNECVSKKSFIMSSDLDLGNLKQDRLNIFHFSDCSIKQLENHLRKSELLGRCLKNSLNVAVLDSFHVMRPGQRQLANEQCLIQFGNTSNIYQCEKENYKNRYNLCTKMLCPYKGMCKGILPLEGTSCGLKMWCYNRRCRSHTKAPDINRECWLGNKKISVNIANKTYLCKDISYEKGKLCYNDEIREQCCWSCSYFQTGDPGCEYGDRIDHCWSRECFFYSKTRATRDCCHTCSFMPKSSSAVRCFNIWHTLCFLFQFIFHIMRQYLLFEK